MDLMTAHIMNIQRQSVRLARSALPHAPVVAHHESERKPAVTRAALAALLLRASRAVAPA